VVVALLIVFARARAAISWFPMDAPARARQRDRQHHRDERARQRGTPRPHSPQSEQHHL
jgi:hypothetical protein